ncbi:MAG: right-handed parallel beta-helix repeat-containing protein [Armatimonadota bacterium]|nr:right-handed parallel beta-helix repeat-containing protein [Armatimonadota bacterium]
MKRLGKRKRSWAPATALWMVILCLSGVVAVALSFPSSQKRDDGPVVYVSPDGNDRWSGTRSSPNRSRTDGPFRTLSRALDEWRKVKAVQKKRPFTIVLRPGTYYLKEPLVIRPEDSGTEFGPLIIRAAKAGTAVLSGGVSINKWTKRGNLWTAQGPSLSSLPGPIRILRVGDRWATPARYPNEDPNDPIKKGWLFAQWWGAPWERGVFNSGVGNIHHKGDRLEWTIRVPASGTYRVWVRYSHHMSTYNVPDMGGRTSLRVGDGPKVPLNNLPDTGGWGSFRWVLSATLPLSAGDQVLIWENDAGGGLNLDAFCLTDDENWNPEQAIRLIGWWGQYECDPVAPGKHLILIQAEACDRAIGKEVSVERGALPGNPERITLKPADLPKWKDWKGAQVHIFPAWGWVNAIVDVKGVDPDRHTLLVQCEQDIRPGNRFYIANVPEALDAPGEWFWDPQTGNITYWADEPDFPQITTVAAILDRLIHLKGNPQKGQWVEHIYIQGLTFRDTTYTAPGGYYDPADAAIWMTGARHCIVSDCTFEGLGGYAVRLDERSEHNKIIGNRMKALGQGGVVLMGNTATQPKHNLIAANEMSDLGQIYKHVAGVYVISGSGNRIAHNRIERVPRYGISLKSLDSNFYSHQNVVEFNELIDTNLETNDTGAIETLGRDQQDSGNVIRWNFIRNVVGLGTTYDGSFLSPYFTWGIYLDDYSSGTLVYGNVVIGTVLGAVCIHGGRNNVIENNIFVGGLERQFTFQPRDEFMVGNIIRKNIFYYDKKQTILFYSWAQTWGRHRLKECDRNIFWCTEGNVEELSDRVTPEGNLTAWREAGFDQNSLVADPLFIAPKQNDFRLRPESPAYRLGFEPIPFEKIGPKGFVNEEKERKKK